MEKTSVRLPPELTKKLLNEVRRRGQMSGEKVTVSDLIRGCIVERFSSGPASGRGETAPLSELKEEVLQLKEHQAQLVREVQGLVRILAELFPELATRQQVDSLTDGVAALYRSSEGR